MKIVVLNQDGTVAAETTAAEWIADNMEALAGVEMESFLRDMMHWNTYRFGGGAEPLFEVRRVHGVKRVGGREANQLRLFKAAMAVVRPAPGADGGELEAELDWATQLVAAEYAEHPAEPVAVAKKQDPIEKPA